MKRCSYCGRENPDDATTCRECGTALFNNELPAAEHLADRRVKRSLRRRAKNLRWRIDHSFRVGAIAMLPAGLLLLVSAIAQLATGNYRIWHNLYGDAVGPFYLAAFGVGFVCVGGLALRDYLRKRKTPRSRDEKPPF